MRAHTLIIRLVSAKGGEWNSSIARKRFWALMYQAGYTNSEYNSNEIDSFSRKYGVNFFDIELEDVTQQRVLTQEFSDLVLAQQNEVSAQMQALGKIIRTGEYYFIVFDGEEVFQYYTDYQKSGKIEFRSDELKDVKVKYGELDLEGEMRFFVLPSLIRSSDNHWKDSNGKERWKKLWLKLKHYYPVKRSNLWAVLGVFIITALILFIILSKK